MVLGFGVIGISYQIRQVIDAFRCFFVAGSLHYTMIIRLCQTRSMYYLCWCPERMRAVALSM